jgi:spore maturation protein SpmB
MAMNIAANMLGLGNAATPLGLKAMRYLEKLNPTPGTASNAMCTFLAINTSSVQLIPTTAVAILSVAGSQNPYSIIGSSFLSTLCACLTGIAVVKTLEKLPMFRLSPADAAAPVAASAPEQAEAEAPTRTLQPLSRKGKYMLALYWTAFLVLLYVLRFPEQATAFFSFLHTNVPFIPALTFAPVSPDFVRQTATVRTINVISTVAVPIMITFFPLYASLRGIKVYEEFVEGAKEGFQVATRIIPYLVAILVAVRMFREAGGIAMISKALEPLLAPLHFPVDLLPLVLVRPLSGSATTGLFTEIVKNFGPDQLISKMAGTIYGSTETTFYVLAVYFGSVGIRRTRHAVPAGLCADLAGVVASVIICRLLFA